MGCYRSSPSLLGLVWFRKREEMTVLEARFGISRATAGRDRDEVIAVLAEQPLELPEALRRVADEGWSHVVLDGKVFRTDRCAEAATSAKGAEMHAWHSGRQWAFGGNIQTITRMDRLPVCTSGVVAGHDHDLTYRHPAAIGRAARRTSWPEPGGLGSCRADLGLRLTVCQEVGHRVFSQAAAYAKCRRNAVATFCNRSHTEFHPDVVVCLRQDPR